MPRRCSAARRRSRRRLVLPLAVAAILWLLNRRGVMGEHRAGPCLNILLALAFSFSLAVAFAGGKALYERFLREPPSADKVAQCRLSPGEATTLDYSIEFK